MITFGQSSTGTATASAAFIIPPGACSVTISNSGGTPAYISGGSNGSATANSVSGFTLNNGAAVTINCFPGSTGEQIWVRGAGTATPAVINWVISTAS